LPQEGYLGSPNVSFSQASLVQPTEVETKFRRQRDKSRRRPLKGTSLGRRRTRLKQFFPIGIKGPRQVRLVIIAIIIIVIVIIIIIIIIIISSYRTLDGVSGHDMSPLSEFTPFEQCTEKDSWQSSWLPSAS